MDTRNSTIARRRKRALAASLTLALGACVADAQAASTFTVTSCADSGAGTLRGIIGAFTTHSGDIVNFDPQLACSLITLTSGEIAINQTDLFINGPGADTLAISAGFTSRVFNHVGTGNLKISSLTIEFGQNKHTNGAATGGCIVANGNLFLYNSKLTNCLANGLGQNSTANAYGGGIAAFGDLTMFNSSISSSDAFSAGPRGWGGGVFVAGNLLAGYTTFYNDAASATGGTGAGGGLFTYHNAVVGSSTFSANHADTGAAWSATTVTNVSSTIALAKSTVSGNVAAVSFGGLATTVPANVIGSTIAFNRATPSSFGAGLYSTGATVTLQSSIIADNTVSSTGAPSDLAAPLGTTIAGADNLITSGHGVLFPLHTISACPKLGALEDNGGATQTHALAHDSPAIDMGNNVENDPTDQRGDGFPRTFGAAADIGAYEWQGGKDDRIFTSRFEPACDN